MLGKYQGYLKALLKINQEQCIGVQIMIPHEIL
jgi:hypothetical protein